MQYASNQEQTNQEQADQKIQKSKFWIIGNILRYTIIGLIAINVFWALSAWLLVDFIGENIVYILNWLVIIFALVFSIKRAVMMTVRNTIVLRKDIIPISVGVMMVFLVFQIVFIALRLANLDQIGQTILIDALLFSVPYYYLNKSVSKNFSK